MPELGEPLSDRELDVLDCIVQGQTNKEIAAELFISENTVKVHLRRIYTKLGVSSRTEAATVALQKGLAVVPGLETTDPETDESSSLEEEFAEEGTAAEPEDAAVEVEETAVSEPPPTPARTFSWRNMGLGTAIVIIAVLLGLLIWQQQNVAAPTTEDSTPTTLCSEQPLGNSRWLVSRAMPTGRAGMATIAVGLDVYLMGGENEQGVVNQVDVYDTVNCQWSIGSPKPTAVSDTTAAVLFGEIYVPGGRGADGQPTDVVEVYSPANNLWRAISPLPVATSGGLVLSQSGQLYYFGGWDGEAYLDTAYEYDPALDSWEALPAMSQPRAFTAGGTIGGQLYIVGGYDGTADLATCAVFDPGSTAWQSCPAMLEPRAGAGSVVLLNKLYVLGGGLQADNAILYGEEYNPVTQTWHVVETPMLDGAAHWFLPGVANVESRIYAFGGRQNDTVLADTYVLRAIYQTFLPAMPNQ